ncbi:MAG: AMP-binding protein [Simkania sp.]|nr:AMP-binding protein [Simkania sp.]
MPRFFYVLSSFLLRLILSLRYRIEVKNLKGLLDPKTLKKGGILFLPNHPAEIDPLVMNALLLGKFQPRPLVIEHFYYMHGAHLFMKWVNALPMPNFEMSANTWKIKEVKKAMQKVQKAIKKGDNFLVYPSGHLKADGREIVGGNSFVHRILELCPEVQIVLVRTTGLWGSTFSRAVTGQSPDFWKMLIHGLKVILKNGIFFVPRRKVTVEFSLPPADFPCKGSRLEINRYLENWYNRYRDHAGYITDREPVKLVSFSLFSKDVPVITRPEKRERRSEPVDVPENIRQDVYEELARLSGRMENDFKDDMELAVDLGLDSLDYASIQAFLDERYDVDSIVPEKMRTVADLFELIVEGKVKGKSIDVANKEQYAWPKEKFRSAVRYPKGETLQEVFLNTCDRMKNAVACGDEVSKFLTYRRLKIGVIVLARKLQQLPDPYIGVLLPSSVGAFALILAILMAGKIPVILNWTAGARSLNFADELLDLKTVFSSRRFLERVDSLELGSLEDKVIVLEEFRKEITLKEKLKGAWLARKKARALKRIFRLNQIKPEDPAVILFTSGTETYPKAVPLTHQNIIANQKSALSVVKINRDDILLGILPPFHSFGFSVTGLLPLLTGLRVFFSPDPTDSHAMARDCYLRDITLLCCAPSFYRNLFRVATPRQLKTVRMFVTGAEKAPKELFDSVANLEGNRILIEGYGITECSPIVTLCPPGEPPKGVGKPLPGVQLCVIHPETEERLSGQKQGEICIKGPNVFRGYMGKNAPNPFIEIDGEKWYRSGDLGTLDSQGALLYSGRMKRFVKIGAEMVSLTALEEELSKHAKKKGWIPQDEETPQLAVGVFEKESGKPLLVLFATFAASPQEVNSALRDLGFGRIVKIQGVKQVAEIPMTGTGKIHFRRINEMLQSEQ